MIPLTSAFPIADTGQTLGFKRHLWEQRNLWDTATCQVSERSRAAGRWPTNPHTAQRHSLLHREWSHAAGLLGWQVCSLGWCTVPLNDFTCHWRARLFCSWISTCRARFFGCVEAESHTVFSKPWSHREFLLSLVSDKQ